MNKNIIEVERFTKKYGDFKAVDDISFTVKEGEIFSLLGPNGAGKSTTINVLCTITNKTAGELRINGYDVTNERSKVRKEIGIVFQETTLDSKLTVEENLKFHCDFYGVPHSEVSKRIDSVLNLVKLEDKKRSSVGSLSGGMKRRVEIARALLHYPKILFLDEPTAGLDPQTRANVWDYIRELQRQNNITIFLTTHYMDEAEISSNVAIVDHGKIVAFGTPYDLKTKFTTTMLKLKSVDPESTIDYLDREAFKFERSGKDFAIFISQPTKIIEVLSNLKKNILDFEVIKGSLNDVFLAVTGREIREI